MDLWVLSNSKSSESVFLSFFFPSVHYLLLFSVVVSIFYDQPLKGHVCISCQVKIYGLCDKYVLP